MAFSTGEVMKQYHAVRCLVRTGLDFQTFSFHKVQQTHAIILDAAGAHIVGKNLPFPSEKIGPYCRS